MPIESKVCHKTAVIYCLPVNKRHHPLGEIFHHLQRVSFPGMLCKVGLCVDLSKSGYALIMKRLQSLSDLTQHAFASCQHLFISAENPLARPSHLAPTRALGNVEEHMENLTSNAVPVPALPSTPCDFGTQLPFWAAISSFLKWYNDTKFLKIQACIFYESINECPLQRTCTKTIPAPLGGYGNISPCDMRQGCLWHKSGSMFCLDGGLGETVCQPSRMGSAVHGNSRAFGDVGRFFVGLYT